MKNEIRGYSIAFDVCQMPFVPQDIEIFDDVLKQTESLPNLQIVYAGDNTLAEDWCIWYYDDSLTLYHRNSGKDYCYLLGNHRPSDAISFFLGDLIPQIEDGAEA